MSASRRLSAASDGRSRAPSLGGPGIGQAVEVQGNRGIVRFSGTTEFAAGRWLGIELEQRHGKNDGSVQGKRYFECPPDHGVFVRASQVKILTSSSSTASEVSEALGSHSRSTIHGTEIQQGASESRLRPPAAGVTPLTSVAAGLDALRAARRTSALPGRLAQPPLSGSAGTGSPATPSGLPPAGSSRLSGSFSQRSLGGQTPTEGSAISSGQNRRISDAHGMATRRTTLTGMKSPTPSGIRSSSRQTATSDSGSAASRPMSREYITSSSRLSTESPSLSPQTVAESSGDAVRQFQSRTQSSDLVSSRNAETTESRVPSYVPEQVPATPVSKPLVSAVEETPRTPYRPALSMNESSTFDMQTPGTSTMSSQTVPLKQYEELRLKYKYLEQKRSEDRQRLQEADKIRAEAEQALRVRDKLATKVTAQQEDMRALKIKLKEVGAEREKSEASYSEAMDMMEMLSVDKEMAEEKAESLAQEISTLREQLAEASTNLDVYKQEGDHSAVLSADRSSATVLEFTQLQKQNERLKEALVRLRDVTTENETHLNQKIKQLEREVQTVQELVDENSLLKEELSVRDSQIEDLKERLDDSFGAEEMIEDLSERNLTLSGKVEELQSTIENLEALCEVNNEMDEARTEELQGLRAEIDKLNVVVNDKNNSIDKLEEAVAVFQYNISQYRELVSSLQGDVQRLREREQSQATEAATISSRTQEMESLSLQLRSTMMKTKSKTIDLEMRRLEADQATEQLHLTASFLPDHFYKSENEALKSLLAFRRLATKGDILCKQLEQEEKTDATISDNFVATAEVRALLIQMSGYAGLFVSFLSTCSDSEFMRLGSLLHDTQGIERRLNGLIDLLRKEEFRASETLPEIRRLSSQLLGLAESHIPADCQATAGHRLGIMVGRLAYGSDVQLSNLFYIEQLLVSGPVTEDSDKEEAISSPFSRRDQQRIAGEVLPAVASVVQNCKASKAVAIKLLRRSDELMGSGNAVSSRAFEQFAQLMQMNRELSDYCVRSRTVIQDYFATAGRAAAAEDPVSSASAVSLEKLLHDVNGIAQDVFGANDAMPMGLALGISQRLTKELTSALAYVANSTNVCKIEAPEAPWIKRAAQFKASLVQNADVERRTEALNEEIISLARELKLRDQALQEYNVKTEMLGKRAEIARKQADQISNIQKELETTKGSEKMYKEATATLGVENEKLEHENRRLKQANAEAKSAAMSGNYSAIGHSTDSPLPTDLLGLRSKVASLQESVAYLRKESAHLRAKYQFKEEMQVLNAEPLVRGPAESSSEISEVVREAKAAAMEACRLAAMPKLVRLSAPAQSGKAASAWQPLSSRPQFELYCQQTLAQALKQRAESVQDRLRSIARGSHVLSAVH
ncbi:hypothetical protein IW140_002061 [Coemansia sp. RSA 1813]|nr:hypothetical protein EV178_000328 [Coemansia sp. RSA 1646]KAJ1772029.1 hypothetical protein LPJ74_001764 [Coemansia sp. RSA 1843]KAJ2090570.1 hypothetical protein IW138_002578 [Coemansia sp. RSA 986]KAJ2216343.1 hypothetical protein EV179_001368 [Coemansia sp. RSA 487]KAJ2570872.1 hypothetical protein IW140_002061 [Coemansia sp. RSA 1813]